jgi:hypothetical protein
VKHSLLVEQDTIDKLKAGRRVVVAPVPTIIGLHEDIGWAKGPHPAVEMVEVQVRPAGHFWHLYPAKDGVAYLTATPAGNK